MIIMRLLLTCLIFVLLLERKSFEKIIIIQKTSQVNQKKQEKIFLYSINEDFNRNDKYNFRYKQEDVSALVFHYTALPYKRALKVLTAGDNSSHWLVPEKGETVVNIVSEYKVARHAGVSEWKTRKNINVVSIGVEVVSPGFICKRQKKFCSINFIEWVPFSETQQNLLVKLAEDIQKRYNIAPMCVIGHSDIAPHRKLDPGPLFPWQKLAEHGVGAWVTEAEIQKEILNINKYIMGDISKLALEIRLYEIGYSVKNDRESNKYLQNKILKYGYNIKKTPIQDLSALNTVNNYGNKFPMNKIFDDKKANYAIDAFLMHYLQKIYLEIENNKKNKEKYADHVGNKNSKKDPDNYPDREAVQYRKYTSNYKYVFATLQALLAKYPNNVRNICGFAGFP